MSWKSLCTTRHDRIRADRRLDRIWALGGIAFQPFRARAIQMRADWSYLTAQVPVETRQVYERLQKRMKPLSDIHCWMDGHAVHALRDDLMTLWRADRRRVA